MKNIIKYSLISISVIFALIGVMAFKKSSPDFKTIAITQTVEHPALDITYKGIIDEIQASGYEQGRNIRLLSENAQGDPVVATQIAQRFAGEKTDVIVAIGTTSAQSAKSATSGNSIPVIFSTVTDPLGAKLVQDLKKPGGNATGTSNWIDVTPQIRKFKEIVPNLKKLGVVYNPGEANSVTMNDEIRKSASSLGIEVVFAPASKTSEVSTATRQLVNKVDAIFVSNDNTALAAFENIVKIARDYNIPVFVSDTDMVDRGAVAALGPNQYELGRQTGRMVLRVLQGERPESLEVQYPRKVEFYLNKDAVAAIRLAVPEETIQDADVLIQKNESLIATGEFG